MKIGYVKIRQAEGGIINNIIYKINSVLNTVKQKNDIFGIIKLNDKTKKKIVNILRKNKIDYAIVENDEVINYPTLDGKYILKYMLPEIVDYCIKILKPKSEQIYICTNNYTSENNELIEELAEKVKVVNIFTENAQYNQLEKNLEKKGIYITVSANKRKSLKKANIVINLDLKNLDDCNINRNMVFIDLNKNTPLPKAFNGIIIKKAEIDTKKVMRAFSDYENFNRSKIIEAEMLKLEGYKKSREFIKSNKLYIVNLKNNRAIDKDEFSRIGKIIQDTKKI